MRNTSSKAQREVQLLNVQSSSTSPAGHPRACGNAQMCGRGVALGDRALRGRMTMPGNSMGGRQHPGWWHTIMCCPIVGTSSLQLAKALHCHEPHALDVASFGNALGPWCPHGTWHRLRRSLELGRSSEHLRCHRWEKPATATGCAERELGHCARQLLLSLGAWCHRPRVPRNKILFTAKILLFPDAFVFVIGFVGCF